jgi:cobalt/nickel transport system permease protein
MGVIGALAVGFGMLAARRLLPRRRSVLLGIVAAGSWIAVMLGALATAIQLAVSGTVPVGTVLPAMLGVHALIGIGEAVITTAAIAAVLATRPDLIAIDDLTPDELGRRQPAPIATMKEA